MIQAHTRREVSGIAFEHVAFAAEGEGIAFADLAGDLVPRPAELREPRRRFEWDLFVAVVERLARRVGGEAECREVARVAARRIRPPFFRLVPRVAPAAVLHLMRWVPQHVYGGLKLGVERKGREVTLTVCLPARARGSRAFLAFFSGESDGFATSIGCTTVSHRIMSDREAELVVRTPPTRLRDQVTNGAILALGRQVFGEVAALGAELAKTQDEREAARAEAARCEAFARTMLGVVEGALFVIDPATLTLRWASPGAARSFGRSPLLLIGRPFVELFAPAERERLAAWARSGGGARLETSATIEAGEQSRELELTLVDHRGEPALDGYLLQASDVTERNVARRAAQRLDRAYASLLVNLRGMAYRCKNDPEWTMELVTDGCEAVTGYSAEALRGNRDVAFGSLVHPDDAGPLWEKCQANLAARRPCQNEYRIRTRDGRWRWILDIAHGVYGSDGSLLAIEGFVTDVDDRHRLEEQLAHATRLDGIGRLAGGVAHDFNNYLSVVVALSGLVRGQLPEGCPARADVDNIESASMKAAELTNQLLSFARKQVLRTVVLSVNEVVLEMDRLLRRTLGAHIEFTTVLAPDLWLTEVDRSQLEQVLLNLAVNARDAMAAGGKLVIETANASFDAARQPDHADVKAGEWVTIAVSDTGTGIPPEVQARLFEPFFTTKSTGTGLGLATTYGAVKQAGGHIFVDSEVGRGTTFKVYLPRSVAQPAKTTTLVRLRPTRGETILLVEDNASLRSVVQRHLHQLGYRVLAAADGAEALEIARAHAGEIHLLLTDVVMPQMGGRALAITLTKDRPTARVLYLSGYAESSVTHGLPGPGAGLLPKPFTPEQLQAKLREVLDAVEVPPQ